MTKQTYIDIHVIQTVPPSNLNRDDAGSPKQAVYGGVRRARVSSQAWKRAARVAFANKMPKAQLGTRTKRIASLLTERLAMQSSLTAEDAARVATCMLAPLNIKPGKKTNDTAYLLFFGRNQVDQLAALVSAQLDQLASMDDDELHRAVAALPIAETLGTGHPLDVALFGRMVADIPSLNIDAATQVAHALSTHPVEIEFDYYTAVDDETGDDETGAAMIGTVEFNSATLYRFATVAQHQLVSNLGGDIESSLAALRYFIDAFIRSMPTGHETSFAHRTVPHLACIVVRDDQPVNLVSAFEAPVRATDGVAALSCVRLAEELNRVEDLWGLTPLSVFATYDVPTGEDPAALMHAVFGASRPVTAAVDAAVQCVESRLTDGPAE